MKKYFLGFALIGLSLSFLACPSPEEVRKEEPPAPALIKKKPATPDIVVQVGSLDLSRLKKRIENADINALADILKQRKIDILTLQGAVRYPGVTTRIDVIDELSRRAEMRQVFGETITLSGKQSGNAIFSTYPIRSSENTHYDKLNSSNFEAALQGVIDCGVRDLVVVSTEIPDKASAEDQAACANLLGSFTILYINHPVIIAGNLPRWQDLHRVESFQEPPDSPARNDVPHYWFSGDGSLKCQRSTIERTPLGEMNVAEFGIFRK
jgi:hypothetical protein